MRILVTGARGKVGSATVAALLDAGHDVTALDLGAPVFEARRPRRALAYIQADLTDAGDAFAAVRGHDAVIHAAALPEPTRNPPHAVFQNNLMATFNVIEAAVRFGVPRLVNVSSETVPGFFFPERPFLPDYAPVDEEHPIRPQDPYATAKHFGEQLMDAAMRRSDLGGRLDPAVLGAVGGQLRAQPRPPALRDPERRRARASGPTSTPTTSPTPCGSPPSATLPATRSSTSPRPTTTPTGRSPSSSATTTATRSSCASSTARTRPGISIAQGPRLLGYDPRRSWRDYLTDDGELRPEAAGAARARRDRRPARPRAHGVEDAAIADCGPSSPRAVALDAGGHVGRVLVERLGASSAAVSESSLSRCSVSSARHLGVRGRRRSAGPRGRSISCVACETSEAPGSSGPWPSDGSTAIGPIASLIPQRPTIWRAIAVSCWMSDSAPGVIVRRRSPPPRGRRARP